MDEEEMTQQEKKLANRLDKIQDRQECHYEEYPKTDK